MNSNKNDETKFLIILELATKILNVVKQITIVWLVCRYGYLSIKSLSGTTTIANIVLSFFMEKTVAEKLTYGAVLVLGTGWYFERRDRRKVIKNKSKEINELKSQIDKKKGTSNLTQYGDTNRDDE